MNLYLRAQELLSSQLYCVLSSASLDGDPWVSPVFYGSDSDLNIFWLSAFASLHSQLFKKNPKASCVIYDANLPGVAGNGLYFSGDVSVRTELVERPLKILKDRGAIDGPFARYEKDDIRAPSPWRLYQFSPRESWMLGENYEVNGWAMTQRIELDLQKLRGAT